MHIALIHYSAPPIVGGVESVLAQHARLMAQAGHAVRILAARGEPLSDQIQFIPLPLIDSRHPRVLEAKAELDRGSVPDDFETLASEITHALQDALADVDVLIAHNVCSLNKNLMLTAAIQRLASRDVTPPGAPPLRGQGVSAAKGLARPAEILHFAQNDNGKNLRVILWHHDLAWTTPRYQAELHDGYPWDLLRTDWGARHVVVSELRQRELADLLHIPIESIAVVPNGIDPAAFFKLGPITLSLLKQIDLARAAPILLLPVRLTPRKNIELALHTLAALRREMPEAILIVTGPLGAHNPANAAYFEKLKNLRAELNLLGAAIFLAELSEMQPDNARHCEEPQGGDEAISSTSQEIASHPSTSPRTDAAPLRTLATTELTIPSYLPDEVIADFYRLADALFVPSREEGFGIPIIEAAFSKLPVFCTDIAPLRALGRDEATYFSPDDDPAHVAQLIADRLQLDARYQFAVRVRHNFSWERIYLDYIAPLLEES